MIDGCAVIALELDLCKCSSLAREVERIEVSAVLDSTIPPSLGALIRRFGAVRFGALLLISAVDADRFLDDEDWAEQLCLFAFRGFCCLSVEAFIGRIW